MQCYVYALTYCKHFQCQGVRMLSVPTLLSVTYDIATALFS